MKNKIDIIQIFDEIGGKKLTVSSIGQLKTWATLVKDCAKRGQFGRLRVKRSVADTWNAEAFTNERRAFAGVLLTNDRGDIYFLGKVA